jgi:hypothetical protein
MAGNGVGRPKASTRRLVLRLPSAFIDQVAEMGMCLSLDTPQAAARHFMTLGMQASLGALNSGRSVRQNEQGLELLSKMVADIAAAEVQSPGKAVQAIEVDMLSGQEKRIKDAPRPRKKKGSS